MVTSTFDPCLLVSTTEAFGLVGMQTDDTLIVATEEFSAKEDAELSAAKLRAKPKECLIAVILLSFNNSILTQEGAAIVLRQKNQADKLEQVDATAPLYYKDYRRQRARAAYIATICQPEASFDLSTAAQHKEPSAEDAKALNRRIQWQKVNTARGIKFIPLDLTSAKLIVFVDGSFANNKDLSS